MKFLVPVLLFAFSASAETISGFEDAKVLADVMSGKIKVEQVSGSDIESTFIIRGFFPKGTPDAYVDVATNHKQYPVWFSEIKEAKTLTANPERTEWTYMMDLVVKYLFITEHVKPEGKQVYDRPTDAISEGVVTHTIQNYSDVLKDMVEKTRLIPYEDGILVHDYIHYTLNKPTSFAETVRKKLKEQFVRFMTVYRTQVSGG